MPPPPVTPSPHRFVIKKRPPTRKIPLTEEQTPRPSTQQFKATPRFNFSSTPRPIPSQPLPEPTPSAARYFTPARPISKQEDIDDNFSDGLQDVHDSIETEDQEQDLEYLSADVEDDYAIEEPSPKRRRVSSSSLLLDEDFQSPKDGSNHVFLNPTSSPIPILSSPETHRPVSTTAPRFLISTPAPRSTPQPSQTTFLKPPRFRPPDPSETQQSQSDPLPEQFSPHRRGQKYLPGGLAAEVRDWLLNIESTVPVNSTQKSKDHPWVVRLVIDEISGGGRGDMTLVRGRQAHSDDLHGMIDALGTLKVILAGEGAGTGLQKGNKVEVGKIVGIKGPVWEVVIEGEKWGVGVDWKVLA